MRKATSRWNINVRRSKNGGQGSASSQRASSPRRQSCKINRQGVIGDDIETIGPMRRDFRQSGKASFVALDGDHFRRSFVQQRAGQAAGAGTDLDDDGAGQGPGGASDAAGQVEIEQKIL